MKKLLALMLCFGMLLSFASSEDLPYARSLSEEDFPHSALLTEETYPQVCIMATGAYYYLDYPDRDPAFLCFSWPQGSQPSRFYNDQAISIDNERKILYHYFLDDRASSFEQFLKSADSKNDIIRDGSDGTAAYISKSPTGSEGWGYGRIKTAEFGEKAMLTIEVRMYEMDQELSLEEQKKLISDALLQEIDRVRSEMNIQIIRPYWSAGKYRGFKMLDYDSQVLVTFDFFPMEARFTKPEDTGVIVSNQFVITRFNVHEIIGYYLYDNKIIKVEIKLNTYGITANHYDTSDKDTGVLRLGNGNDWYYHLPNRNEDGSIYAWRAEKKIKGFTAKNNDAYYIEFYFSGTYGVIWETPEACENIIRELDSHLRFVSPSEDEYIAP